MNTKLLELIAEVKRLTYEPKRATALGFLLAMIYATLSGDGKQKLIECLEEIAKNEP